MSDYIMFPSFSPVLKRCSNKTKNWDIFRSDQLQVFKDCLY